MPMKMMPTAMICEITGLRSESLQARPNSSRTAGRQVPAMAGWRASRRWQVHETALLDGWYRHLGIHMRQFLPFSRQKLPIGKHRLISFGRAL